MERLATLLLILGLASRPLWARRTERDTVIALEKVKGRTKHLRMYLTVTLLLTDTLPRATTERTVHRAEGGCWTYQRTRSALTCTARCLPAQGAKHRWTIHLNGIAWSTHGRT